MKVEVNNEYSSLKAVLLASVDTFKLHQPINRTQEYFYKYYPPVKHRLIEQQTAFVDVLTQYEVQIIWAPQRQDCTNQVNTRDVGFAIGSSFVVSPMAKRERQREHLALEEVIESFQDTSIYRPTRGLIEGGDIVVDNKQIYVGLSERTNNLGYKWVLKTFGQDYEVVAIELAEGYLHLDTVFNIISDGVALADLSGIMKKSQSIIESRFEIISVGAEEQFQLATNVFSINPNVVVCDNRNVATNEKIAKIGKELILLDYDEITKIGGSFRCGTCPLIRSDY